jgi:hypothetical protein
VPFGPNLRAGVPRDGRADRRLLELVVPLNLLTTLGDEGSLGLYPTAKFD